MEFGDRLFWAIMIFIGITLFWVGVLETFIPLWTGAILGAVAGVAFINFGPHSKFEEPERVD